MGGVFDQLGSVRGLEQQAGCELRQAKWGRPAELAQTKIWIAGAALAAEAVGSASKFPAR